MDPSGATSGEPDQSPPEVGKSKSRSAIRRFGAEVNEAAEDFMTPRDVVHLAIELLLDSDDQMFIDNPGLIRTLYDPTCGTGGFLSDGMEHVNALRDQYQIAPVTYNRRLAELRDRASAAEDAWQRAKNAGNEDGMKRADHEREQVETAIVSLTDFKAGLARFGRLYVYIAQLVDLGDPGLETFAAFAKLLANRLNGIPPNQIDLHGIALTGYQITQREPTVGEAEPVEPILEPIGDGGGSARDGALPIYIQELIERLNSLFGEATPIQDQVAFVNQVAAITRENRMVMAQIEKNTKDQAMKGNLPGAVQAAVVRAMSSHSALATLLLSKYRQALPLLEGLIYEIQKRGDTINLNALRAR